MDELGEIPHPGPTPWPHPQRFAITRRLLAYYRWGSEGNVEATNNARASVIRRTDGPELNKGARIFDE